MGDYKLYFDRMNLSLSENELVSSLPSKIVNHCKKYKQKGKYLQSLNTWFYLSNILKSDYDYNLNEENIILVNDKPHLKDNPLYFNISHSDEAMAIIIASKECGIDIQKEFTNFKIATKILSDKEYEEYLGSNDKVSFLNYKWVIKEAYGKYLATGVFTNILKETIENKNIKKVLIGKETYYLSWYVKE